MTVTVGLTGGIGAGKSEVVRMLAAHGAVVVDADVLAREALAPGSAGLDEVLRRFGPAVRAPDGSLDRPALGRIVFGDEQARRDLEAVVHPFVARRSAEIAAAAGQDAVVVHDVPLLVEKGMQDRYDVVVVVDADESSRLRRLVDGRGMAESDARAVMAAQASRVERLAIADVVLENDADLAALAEQVDRLWVRLRSGTSADRPEG